MLGYQQVYVDGMTKPHSKVSIVGLVNHLTAAACLNLPVISLCTHKDVHAHGLTESKSKVSFSTNQSTFNKLLLLLQQHVVVYLGRYMITAQRLLWSQVH